MASDRPPPRTGDTLAGRYRLERALGSGGMGTVFTALDVTTRRPVAVKVMHPRHAADRALVARFLREAKAVSMVRHPNVVEVLDHGVGADGTPFIVEERLEGTTLAKHLTKVGSLPVDEALRIMLPVVEAVAQAHARGVIHRDLNPSNIFLPSGRGAAPKVLDFGISKITSDIGPSASASGINMGTPAYMPPEQVRSSRSADARADVWAIGVILFEMVSGRLPFVESETSSMFVAICTSTAPRLDTIAPGVPEALAALVEGCLRSKREDRFADAAAVLEALRALSDELARVGGEESGERGAAGAKGSGAPVALRGRALEERTPGRPRWFVAALAIIALIGLAVAGLVLAHGAWH